MRMLSTYLGEYLFTFLTYGIAAIIIAIIVCRLRSAGQRKFWTIRNTATLVFAVYLACLLSITILPRLDFWYMQDGEWGIETYFSIGNVYRKPNLIPFREIINDLTGNTDDSVLNLLGNMAIFLPFGFLIPVISGRRKFKIVLVPMLTSVAIEAVQFFEGRRCDIDDVILNTAGAIIGWVIFRIMHNAKANAHT